MKFYTSDLHLDHHRVIILSKRPFFNVKDMFDNLVINWNKKVSSADDVYLIGDTFWNIDTFVDFASKVNGNIHLINGNHDAKEIRKLKTKMSLPLYKNVLKHVWFHGDIHNVVDNNKHVVLCHYPMYEWPGKHKGCIHIHGHTHGNIGKSFIAGAYDVSVDIRNFEPKSLEEIINDNS